MQTLVVAVKTLYSTCCLRKKFAVFAWKQNPHFYLPKQPQPRSSALAIGLETEFDCRANHVQHETCALESV
jgi:hypothetical protein